MLLPEDLAVAYTRAGNTFNGALSQYFIVLSDNLPRPVQLRTGGNVAALGRRGGRGGRVPGSFPGFRRPSLAGAATADRGLKRLSESGDTISSPHKKSDSSICVLRECAVVLETDETSQSTDSVMIE